MPVRCCETCLSFGARTMPDGVPICHACMSWTTKAMCDDALRATNTRTLCTLYRPAPVLMNAEPACCRCSHYQPQDHFRPCAAARAFRIYPFEYTSNPAARHNCWMFDINPHGEEVKP
ncbi:hypothetical protein [Cupriavidus oxalaticus]|uniref:Uncharacterized protein n=1 Tax=Cupriavidus oxalaticus TaxID=96344 RepID=A0A4P7L9U1_9BURK|nr:hypothetical protein [Cupriavidus oxalaticus]QBY52530.1 hypothetical protein E0W60_15175 [Cupriavidus oxalaticus]